MMNRFTLILLISVAIHGTCSAKRIGYDVDGYKEEVGKILLRARRTVCSKSTSTISEKYFYRMYFTSAQNNGRVHVYHDTINLHGPKLVTGWSIEGRSSSNTDRPAGRLTEYVMYYKTIDGSWKQFVNTDSGDKVFRTNGGIDSPTTVTRVRLARPVTTSKIRLYPRNYIGFPYSKVKIHICLGGLHRNKTRKPTTITTSATTVKPTTTTVKPEPKIGLSRAVSQNKVVAAIKKIKDLENVLSILQDQKKEIEKEIKKSDGLPIIRHTKERYLQINDIF